MDHISIDAEIWAIIPQGTPVFGGMAITNTLLTALAASGILIIIAVFLRIFAVPRFSDEPKPLQNVLELIVDSTQRLTQGKIGQRFGEGLAPYIFTVAAFVGMNGILELIGCGIARPASSDLNCTFALALISFVLIQAYALRKKGLMGRIKTYAKPAFIFPIKLITDIAVPVSLACRMFGNILGGMIVMELVYSVAAMSFVLPAILSAYFTLFHTGMQVFIFITLTLSFIEEAVE